MRRLVLILGCLILLVTQSLSFGSKEVKTGMLKAFGYVTDSNGVKKSVAGMEFPFTIERVESVKLKPRSLKGVKPADRKSGAIPPRGLSLPRDIGMLYAANLAGLSNLLPVALFDATIYMADANTTYGIFEEEDPSSLDDMQLAGGAGQPWKNLTFGFHLDAVPAKFLVRWRCYANTVTGLGHDVSAFNQEFNDFGVYMPASQIPGGSPGTYKITINVAASGVVAPSTSVYVASQFRIPRTNPLLEDGEGDFDTRIHNVYNNTALPTVGSSENHFYYDWDPLNGIYADDELETVSDGFSNLLFGISAGGTVDTLNPFQFSIPQGTLISGELIDSWFSDNTYIEGQPLFNVSRTTPPLQFVFDGIAASTSANSLTFKMEAAGSSGGGTQSVTLFNYVTNAYEQLDSRAISSTDAFVQVVVASNPTRFINPTTKRMKAKIDYFPPANASRTWRAKIDQIQWIISRP